MICGIDSKQFPGFRVESNSFEMFYEKGFDCSLLTRLRTGGSTAYFATVNSRSDLIQVTTFARDRSLPLFVIGAGSNVVISDEIFRGCVIKLSGEFRKIIFTDKKVTCGAGHSLIKLGLVLAKRGFSGYEYMAVIPGSVGGAVRMNAGTTKYGEIKDHFISATIMDPATGIIRKYTNEDMLFSYRGSSLLNSNRIILEASFELPRTGLYDSQFVFETIRRIQSERRKKQPRNPRTFGSVFKRPDSGQAAGWYLEKVGMKGLRVGGAMVPHEHANWIINTGGATSSDVRKLISIGQKRVLDEFGVVLEREVIYLPEDMEKWD